jgi:hypothetical protein
MQRSEQNATSPFYQPSLFSLSLSRSLSLSFSFSGCQRTNLHGLCTWWKRTRREAACFVHFTTPVDGRQIQCVTVKKIPAFFFQSKELNQPQILKAYRSMMNVQLDAALSAVRTTFLEAVCINQSLRACCVHVDVSMCVRVSVAVAMAV